MRTLASFLSRPSRPPSAPWSPRAPIVVSLSAACISFTNLWYTSFRPSDVVVQHGPKLDVMRWKMDRTLALQIPLTLANRGARTGSVQRLAVEVTGPSGTPICRMPAHRYLDVEERVRFGDYVAPEVLGGEETIHRFIQFACTDGSAPQDLAAGLYEVRVLARIDQDPAWRPVSAFAFALTVEDAAGIALDPPETRMFDVVE